MDPNRFDTIARTLADGARSRRGVFHFLGAGLLGFGFGQADGSDVAAHDALARCRKIKNKAKRKQCVKQARKHNAGHDRGPRCGSVTCASGQRCCPDQKCGARCCANGRACDVVCSGPHGNDYCCHESRPVAICGGCWQAGSVQCSTPGHCCGPNQVCCGDDHCCDITTQECRVNCAGVQGSNSCCKKGSVLCCPDGEPG